MGKKSLPTAENSGMSKNSILKYVFIHKKPVNPENKGATSTQFLQKQLDQLHQLQSQSQQEDTSSDDSSAPPSSPGRPGPARSQSQHLASVNNSLGDSNLSQPLVAVNYSIFENSPTGSPPFASQSRPFGVWHNKKEKLTKADSGISDNDTSETSEEVEEDSQLPRIVNVQSLSRNSQAPSISGISSSQENNNGSSDEINSEPFKFTSSQLRRMQKRDLPVEEGGSPSNKKRRISGVSSNAESTHSAAGSGADVLKPKNKPKDAESRTGLIDRKRWDVAIPQLMADIDKNEYPNEIVMAQILMECVLKPRRSSAIANELMEKILSKCDKRASEKTFDFILGAIRSVSAELDEDEVYEHNCYWLVMENLFQSLILNAKSKCSTEGNHILKFCNIFVELLEKLFKINAKSRIHLNPPMVVQIFEGVSFDESQEVRRNNLGNNVARLIQLLLDMQNFEPEMNILCCFLSQLARHYYNHRNKKMKETLIERVSAVLAGTSNYGFGILHKIKEINFGKDVCLKIIDKHVQGFGTFSLAEQSKFLTCLARSNVIRRHYYEPMDIRATKEDTCRVTKVINGKGETVLHRLCGDSKKHGKVGLTLEQALDEIAVSETGTVNVPDNGANFPLHDAADNGRIDQLKILQKKCCKNVVNDRLKVNPLVRNTNGDTPLHLAAQKGNLQVVKELVKVIGDKISLNLAMANYLGHTPITCSKAPDVTKYLKSLQSSTPTWESDFHFLDCKLKLPVPSVTKIKNDIFQQKVVYQFNKFNETCWL